MLYRNIISRNINDDVYLKKGKLFKIKKPFSDYWIDDALDELTDEGFLGVLKENNLVKTQGPSCPIIKSDRLDKIHLQLNNTCMCHCPHCYVGEMNKSELSLNDVKNILEQAMECGVLTIEYSGGEPTINKDFIEIIKYGKSMGFNQMLFTNGFVNSSYFDAILEYIDIVQISIDGPKEYHNSFRKNKLVFDKALSTIKSISGGNTEIIVSMSVMPENIEHIPYVYGVAKGNGAAFRLSPPAPVGRCSKGDQSFYLDYLRNAKEICVKNNIELKEFVYREPSCSAIRKTVYINSLMQVFPCPLLSDARYLIGNLNEERLKDLIDNKKSQEVLEFIDETKRKTKKSCFFCPAFLQEADKDCWFFGEMI